MVIRKTNTVGVDKKIDKYQKDLHDFLMSKWGIADTAFRSYPRIYRNEKNEKAIPELYEGDNNYKEVYFDDASYSFFGVGERVDYKAPENTASVYLVFRVNLSAVKPDVSHRADEEVRIDVQQFAVKGHYGFQLQSIETGVSAAFREFQGWIKDAKFSDMQPWHVFRLNLQVRYDSKIC